MFALWAESSARRVAWLLVCFGLSVLPLVFVAFRDLETSSGDVTPWMPEGTPERLIYDEFADIFQTHDTLLVAWEGVTSGDEQLGELAWRIREADDTRTEETGEPGLIGKITSLEALIDSFGEPFRSNAAFRERIAEEVSGYLTGKDGSAGVLVIGSSAEGAERREATFDLVDTVVREVVPDAASPKYAGPCFLAICASEETTKLLRFVTPLTAVISLIVAFVFLRSLTLALLAFSISALSASLAVAAIHFSGNKLGDMLSVVPSLAQLLAMSNVVHLINYYLESLLHQGDPKRAWRDALRNGWLPTVAASVTTIIGFAALFSSNLPVARSFAFFGIVGIAVAMVVVLLLTPALLILLLPPAKPPMRLQSEMVRGLKWLTSRHKWGVTVVLLTLFGFAGMGLGKLGTDVMMESFFPERSKFHHHYRWYQEHFGSAQGSDLLVVFDEAVPRKDQFSFIETLTERVRATDGDYAVFSPALFTHALPGAAQIDRMRQAGHDPHEQVWEQITKAGWAATRADRAHWRISIHHPLEPDPRKSLFRSRMLGLIEDAEEEFAEKGAARPDVHLTGGYQLFSNSQDSLVTQLLRTFLLAFFIITPVVMWFMRSVLLGLVAIIGNLFPLVVFFGMMGWIGLRIDIATMMIAAVAFGIAVDDTVHFLTWMGRGMERKHKLGDAVHYALDNCAGAILQTTLIISLGMMAFLLSDFRPSARFAMFSALVLVIAVVGDLILLPSLILGMFSRFFQRTPPWKRTS